MGGSEHFSSFADLPAPLDLLACAELAWQIDRVQMPLIGASAPLEALLERYTPFPDLEGEPRTSESEVLTPSSHPTLKFQDEAVPAGHSPTVSWSEVGRAWMELGFFVLQHACDTLTREAFERWHARLEPGYRLDPEWRARWYHERALFHLGALELEPLRTALARWPEDLSVPYFEILRATLLAELGQDAEASRSVRAALGAVRGRLTPGQTDYALLSQEGWALTLLDRLERVENASGVWPAMQHSARLDQLRLHLCDPHAYLEASSSALELFSETVPSWLEVQRPAFDPERIIRGTRMHSSSTPLFWAFGWLRLLERGGVPTRVGSVSYDLQTLVKVAKIVGDAMPLVGARLYFRAHTPELLEQFYAREVLASLVPEVVSDLFNFIFAAYKTAHTALIRQTQGAWGGLYRAVDEQAPEVISRLIHFVPLEQVKEALDFLVAGYPSEQDRLNSDRVAGWDLILARLVARLSPGEAVELLPRLLEVPLTGERSLPLNQGDGDDFFGSLTIKASGWQGQYSAAWTSAIDRLLIHMESEQLQTRSQALRRLHFLYKAGVFSEAQKLHFSSLLWNYTDEVGLPLQNSLYPVALLALPEPSSGHAESILRSYLLGPVPNIINAQGSRQFFLKGPHPAVMWFKTLRGSSQRVPADERSGLEVKLEWTEAQAGDLLERLVTWWGAHREHQDVSFSMFPEMDDLTYVTQNWLPAVLTEVILPRLTLTNPAIREAQSLIDELRLKGCWSPRYQLLSQLSATSGFEALEHEIRQGLLSGIPAQRNQFIWGAFQWMGLARLRDISTLPAFVRGLLFAQVSSHDPEGIRQFVEALADLVRYIPEALELGEMESLFEVARYLEGVTRLAQTSGERPDPGRPTQRSTASRLAWALNCCWHSYHADEPNSLLEALQQIYARDVLYEVRKVWWE